MSGRFVYELRGGPFHGKQIVGRDDLWREEIAVHDPYAENGTAKAIYGFMGYQYHVSPRILRYWGSQPCSLRDAKGRMPEFYT
jgi:hypothetical protein